MLWGTEISAMNIFLPEAMKQFKNGLTLKGKNLKNLLLEEQIFSIKTKRSPGSSVGLTLTSDLAVLGLSPA